jgi:hypothetical protein
MCMQKGLGELGPAPGARRSVEAVAIGRRMPLLDLLDLITGQEA